MTRERERELGNDFSLTKLELLITEELKLELQKILIRVSGGIYAGTRVFVFSWLWAAFEPAKCSSSFIR